MHTRNSVVILPMCISLPDKCRRWYVTRIRHMPGPHRRLSLPGAVAGLPLCQKHSRAREYMHPGFEHLIQVQIVNHKSALIFFEVNLTAVNFVI